MLVLPASVAYFWATGYYEEGPDENENAEHDGEYGENDGENAVNEDGSADREAESDRE